MKTLLILTALLGGLGVAVGAFGAHGLKSLVDPAQVETFQTGVRYQFYHVMALGLAAALWLAVPEAAQVYLRTAGWFWLGGIVLFSGSLYLLSLRDVVSVPVGVLGPITPLGGLLFIVGWGFLFLAALKLPAHG